MQNTTLYVRSIGIMAMISLVQVIAFAQTSVAIDKPSESISKFELQGLQHTSLVRSTSVPKAIDYFMLGAQKVRQRDYNGALANFNRAIQLDPNFSYAYNARGAIKAEISSDYQGGLADFNRAIQLDPNLAGAYKNRAVLKAIKINDIQGGLADFNRAIQLDPKYAGAYALRGDLKIREIK